MRDRPIDERSSFYARHGAAILLLAALVLPLVLLQARAALRSNSNDVRQWLPHNYPETADYAWFKRHFGAEEIVVATWEGCTADDPRLPRFAQTLLRGLPGEPAQAGPLFKRVVTGRSVLDQVVAPPLNLDRDEAARRFRGTLFGPDGQQTCAVITLAEGAGQRLRPTLEAIRHAAEHSGIPPEKLRLGGPPLVNDAINATSARSLVHLTGLSALVGLLIAWRSFRTLRMTLLVFGVGLYAAAASLAVVSLTGASMNAILMTMGPLVYVATMSGAIHLANYYRDAVRDFGPRGAASRAVADARLPLALATATTAVGLLSLCYSELLPIQWFGLYSAVGVVLGLVLLFLVMPSVLEFWPPAERGARHSGTGSLSPGWDRFAHLVVGHHALLGGACLLLVGAGVVGLTRIETSIKIMRFFPRDAPIIETYRWMEGRLAALVPMEVVVRVDDRHCRLDLLERLELVRGVEERLARHPSVKGTLSAVALAPDVDAGGGPQWLRRSVYEKRLAEQRERFGAAGYLRRTDDEELWRITLRVSALDDVDYGAFLEELRRQVEPALRDDQGRRRPGLSATYTGLVPVVSMAQRSLLDGLVFGFGTDLALVVAAIVVLLRHWSAGVLLLAVCLFPTAIVFGAMAWSGVLVDIGTVMTPSVALGVCVDDAVHFVLWFRRGIERGQSRSEAVMLAYQACARAMYQSWGVIGLGLSAFAFSSFTPTMRFGAMMVALLTAGLAGTLVFLPALLAGPLGGIIAGGILARPRKPGVVARLLSLAQTAQPEPAEEEEGFVRPRRRSVPAGEG